MAEEHSFSSFKDFRKDDDNFSEASNLLQSGAENCQESIDFHKNLLLRIMPDLLV